MFLEAGLSGLKSKRLQGWLLLEARGDTLTLSPSQPLGGTSNPWLGAPRVSPASTWLLVLPKTSGIITLGPLR